MKKIFILSLITITATLFVACGESDEKDLTSSTTTQTEISSQQKVDVSGLNVPDELKAFAEKNDGIEPFISVNELKVEANTYKDSNQDNIEVPIVNLSDGIGDDIFTAILNEDGSIKEYKVVTSNSATLSIFIHSLDLESDVSTQIAQDMDNQDKFENTYSSDKYEYTVRYDSSRAQMKITATIVKK